MELFSNIFDFIIFLGIAAVVLELFIGVSTGFDLLITGIIFVIAGLLGSATDSVNILWFTIIILSFAYIVIGRKVIKQKLSIATKSTNVDSLIGKKARVTKLIQPGKAGQVVIDSEQWRAESAEKHDIDAHVTVKTVSGVTVTVE